MNDALIVFLITFTVEFVGAASPGVFILLHQRIPHRGWRVCRSSRCNACSRMRAMGLTSYGRAK